MKLTKEKMIYFISLNIFPVVIVGFICYGILVLMDGIDALADLEMLLLFLMFIFLPIFIASILAFFYAYRSKDKYNILICSLLTGIILPIEWMMLFFDGFILILKNNFFDAILGNVFCYLLAIGISLAVLSITNPLRKKIKW